MRNRFLLLLLFVSFTAAGFGQHGVNLTVIPATDAVSTSTYNIYSAKAKCSTNPTLTLLVSLPAGTLTYFDPEGVGAYCYTATQVQNGAESAPTANVAVSVSPNAPGGLNGKSQ